MKGFKKAISVVLSCAIVAGSCFTGQISTVKAVSTTASDGSVSGTGSAQAAKGNWCTSYNNPTVYRIYPIYIGEALTSDSKPDPLNYNKHYYKYRDIALYVSSSTDSDDAYYFRTTTKRGANTIKGMTLSHSLKTDALGVSLDLPKHKFEPNASSYVSFSDELNKKIITDGKNQNITSIFSNYLYQVEKRRNSLSSSGENEFKSLCTALGVSESELKSKDEIEFSDTLKDYGLVIEVCSLANNKTDGKRYVVSYGDLTEGTKIGSDAYYVYKVFKQAADDNKLLTWTAKDNISGVKLNPEKALGEASYFFNNVDFDNALYQAINVVVGTNNKITANEDYEDLYHTYKDATSRTFPLEIGTYINTNTVKSSIRINGEKTDSNDKGLLLSRLSGFTGYDENTVCIGYDVLAVPFESDSYKARNIHNVDIEKYLQNIKAKNSSSAVENGFGKTYGVTFYNNSNPVVDLVKKSVKDAKIFDKYNKISSRNQNTFLTLDKLADVQATIFLGSKGSGKYDAESKSYKGFRGTYYVSIAYLAQNTEVKGKEAEVAVDADGGISVISDIKTKKYSVADTATWKVAGADESATYAIAWNSSDYKLEDAKNLASSIMDYAGGARSTSEISGAFSQATGVTPIGVKNVNAGDEVLAGSVADKNKDLHGVNILILNISTKRPVEAKASDLVESDELNYIYPNLLGANSYGHISPIGYGVANMIYPYTVTDNNSGDLVSFKGSKAHYYYRPTGLYDIYATNPKSFNSMSYPSYAYNLSRGLWGDAVVASNYRGISATDSSVQNDIKNVLGLNIGAAGKKSPVALKDNQDGRVKQSKHDNYRFKATIHYIVYTMYGSYIATTYQYNNYALTHALNKYTCMALGIADNAKRNKAGFNIQDNKQVKNKVTMVTQSDKELSVYPEVAYKYYKAEKSNGVLNNVSPLTVYVMGEKVRKMHPSAIRGIAMDYMKNTKDVASGNVKSDGMVVGTDAAGQSDGLQVVTQGADVSMKANHTVDYRLISYALDVSEKVNGVNVRKAFSSENEKYDTAAEHEDYVNEFMDKVQVDTFMIVDKKEYEMKTSNVQPKVVRETENSIIPIEFAKGHITESSKNKVIYDMQHEYDISFEQAKELFKSSGFEKQLQDMFESSNESINASNKRWYDEESITICIQKYVTHVDLRDCIVSDKMDYNVFGADGVQASGQNKVSTKKAYFEMSVYVPDDFEGCNLKNANILFERKKIKDSDFRVSSASTNDMIRN